MTDHQKQFFAEPLKEPVFMGGSASHTAARKTFGLLKEMTEADTLRNNFRHPHVEFDLMFNPGDQIWVNHHWGPKCGTFQRVWREKNKVLLEFQGSPELVEIPDCFLNERDCYAAAAAKKQKEALVAMKLASEYSRKACGASEPESE